MDTTALGNALLFFTTVVLSLSVHEFSHAFVALKLGDPTARDEGRVSLNPLNHLDPMGTLMLLFLAMGGVGLGWAKPVPVNPFHLREPRRDLMLISLAGPVSNLLQAMLALLIFTGIFRAGVTFDATVGKIVVDFFRFYVLVNVSLFAFNMLPVFPLDGSKIYTFFLPRETGIRFEMVMARAGMVPLLVIIAAEFLTDGHGPLSWVLWPAVEWILGILPGDVGVLFL